MNFNIRNYTHLICLSVALALYFIVILPTLYIASKGREFSQKNLAHINPDTLNDYKFKALLATRFQDLNHLKDLIEIKYDRDYSKLNWNECKNSSVTITYSNKVNKIARTMSSGINQNEIYATKKLNPFEKLYFTLLNPTIVRDRIYLEKAFLMSRRKPAIFGPIDFAFYDLAVCTYKNIYPLEFVLINKKDSSEKGFINTFNHITAQALLTAIFSENLSDLISDLHERSNMFELTCGKFTESQLTDSITNPLDNYVDIINNEIGQRIGLSIKKKYCLNENTYFSPKLLSNILNDVQTYYICDFDIGLKNFRPNNTIIKLYSAKINNILNSNYSFR